MPPGTVRRHPEKPHQRMTVICETCRTANRDKAMFCIGCAGKLPAFAATGPAALATAEAARRQRKGGGAPAARRSDDRRVLHWWFAAVLLLGGVAAALVGWIALTPGRTTAAVAVPASAAVPPATAPPAGPVPFESALSPGESAVTPGQQPARTVGTAPEAAPATGSVAAPAPRTASARAPASRGGGGRADPRVGCEHLFFAFAARCEANHCAEAAYARHPRCDVVRAERQRDDARRNMTSGY